MSSVAVFRRRLLGGGEELEEGRGGVETGRTRRALSVSGRIERGIHSSSCF